MRAEYGDQASPDVEELEELVARLQEAVIGVLDLLLPDLPVVFRSIHTQGQ